jgi:thiamine-phosphate pyrophosphorylase
VTHCTAAGSPGDASVSSPAFASTASSRDRDFAPAGGALSAAASSTARVSFPGDGTGLRERRAAQLADARLYVCTNARRDRGDLEAFLHAAYSGGADIVQLRDKALDTADEIAALQVLARVAAEHESLFAVNDRADIAALVGADVFHIGQRDLAPAQARQLLGADVLIGRSTHSREQAATALADPDVDYFCTGPVWATPTKPGRPATGVEFVAAASELVNAAAARKPWFAIGGIDADRLPQVRAAGAERIVVVRAVADAGDPTAAASRLRGMLRS